MDTTMKESSARVASSDDTYDPPYGSPLSNNSLPPPPRGLRPCLRSGPRSGRRRSDSLIDRPSPTQRDRRVSETPTPTDAGGPAARGVAFAAAPVSAYLPRADPLALMGAADVCQRYREMCDAHDVLPLLSVLEQLQRPADQLQLRGEQLQQADADALEAVLQRRQWRRLDASGALAAGAAASLLQQVVHYDSAAWLSVAGAALDRHAWTAVAQLVREAGVSTSLQWLSLEAVAVPEPAAAALARALRCSQLRVLHLERCGLHGRPLSLLAGGLRYCRGLRQLFLADNGLSTGDGSLLGAALRYNTDIQLLDLRNNALDDDSVGYLLRGVAAQEVHAPTAGLLGLNLWNNLLTAGAAEPVAELLATHVSIETLNLGRNALGDEAMSAIAPALVDGNAPLCRLGLQRCRLTGTSAAALARVITESGTLTRLDLRGNALTVAGLRELEAAVKDGTTLQQLDLDKADFHEGNHDSGEENGGVERKCQTSTLSSRYSQMNGSVGHSSDSPDWSLSVHTFPRDYFYSLDTSAGLNSDDIESDQASSDRPAKPAPPKQKSLSDDVIAEVIDSDESSGAGDDSNGITVGDDVTNSDDVTDSDISTLLASIAAACAANRRTPAPAVPLSQTKNPPGEPSPPGSRKDRFLRRLSAALRKVSLTCETPSLSLLSTPVHKSVMETKPIPIAMQRPRKLVSPAPSPNASPLPSPSRFRVIKVGDAEIPGTPPLPRGLLKPPGTQASRWSPSPSPEPERRTGLGTTRGDDRQSAPERPTSLDVLQVHSQIYASTNGPKPDDGTWKDVWASSSCESPVIAVTSFDSTDSSHVASSLHNGSTTGGSGPAADPGPPTVRECARASPSPRSGRRSFRVTPVRETVGHA